jgi:hypothetical protein
LLPWKSPAVTTRPVFRHVPCDARHSLFSSVHTLTPFFASSPAVTAEIAWVPGHKGIKGNERVDSAARAGATIEAMPYFKGSTITWARASAKSRAAKTWRTEWPQLPHTNLLAVALRAPPSTTLAPFHRSDTANQSRDIHARIIHIIAGHGSFGDRNRRYVPTELTACLRNGITLQTHDHILVKCPLYDVQRHHLRNASHTLFTPFILGTRKGLTALAKFLKAAPAFEKPVHPPSQEPDDEVPPSVPLI